MVRKGVQEKEKGAYRILIVDDEISVGRALGRTFKRNNLFKCDISLVHDAESALDELRRNRFDLVIADLKMPEMNGVDLLGKVRDDFPKTARVLITGFSEINVAREAYERANIHRYIEKPWNNEEIPRIILEVLTEELS